MFGLGVLGNLGLVGGGGVPSWVPVADGFPADLAFDFTQNLAWTASTGALSTASSLLTCTRAISGTGHTYDYAADSLGVYSGFLANVPRITNLGLLVEESRVNVVLNNRDLTQGSWTPSNVTAAKDQVGVDGVANSASSIVATAGNGTILGATTVSSSARWQTAFVKRLVGTGTVQMTMDNGSTWTTITVTSSWSRVSIPTQTLANPTVGFKIVTSGDKVAVDFVQNEASNLFATSPIATTSAAVTRNADSVVLTSLPAVGSAYSALGAGVPIAPTSYGGAQNLIQSDNTTNNQRLVLRRQATTGALLAALVGGTGTVINLTGPWAQNALGKFAAGVIANSQGAAFNATLATDTTVATLPTTPTALRFGSNATSGEYFNGFITSGAFWLSRRITDAGLQGLTT